MASTTGTLVYKLLTSNDRICSSFSSFFCSRVRNESKMKVKMKVIKQIGLKVKIPFRNRKHYTRNFQEIRNIR